MTKKYKKQVSLGYAADGSRIRKWFYGDTKAELEKSILAEKIAREKMMNPTDLTFREFAGRWFETYKAHRSGKTKEMYQFALKKCDSLNPYMIRKITRSMCQKVISELWEHPRTAGIVAGTMKQIFRTAVADGMIAMNPAEALSLPKKKKSHFHLLTEEELNAVDRADLSDQDRLFVTILRVFGLRPAEALALQRSDFDFASGVLSITKSLEMTNDGNSRIKDTKTGVSREIPIPADLIAPLRKRIRKSRTVLLFPKADGHPYTKSAYRCLSERIHKALNEVAIREKVEALEEKTKAAEAAIRAVDYFPEFTLYCFRHRRATDLYYLTQTGEISTKKAAALMGHSEVVFLSTYAHIDESKEGSDIYSNAVLPKAENL